MKNNIVSLTYELRVASLQLFVSWTPLACVLYVADTGGAFDHGWIAGILIFFGYTVTNAFFWINTSERPKSKKTFAILTATYTATYIAVPIAVIEKYWGWSPGDWSGWNITGVSVLVLLSLICSSPELYGTNIDDEKKASPSGRMKNNIVSLRRLFVSWAPLACVLYVADTGGAFDHGWIAGILIFFGYFFTISMSERSKSEIVYAVFIAIYIVVPIVVIEKYWGWSPGDWSGWNIAGVSILALLSLAGYASTRDDKIKNNIVSLLQLFVSWAPLAYVLYVADTGGAFDHGWIAGILIFFGYLFTMFFLFAMSERPKSSKIVYAVFIAIYIVVPIVVIEKYWGWSPGDWSGWNIAGVSILALLSLSCYASTRDNKKKAEEANKEANQRGISIEALYEERDTAKAAAEQAEQDENGTYTFPKGKIQYVGERKGGKPHGQGTSTHKNGTTYTGGWKDSKYHGEGTEKNPGRFTYTGGWKDGKCHGQGTQTYSNGATYTGGWKDSKHHGEGAVTYADGMKYVGGWRDGKQHGQGTCTWPHGDRYVGGWRDGKQHGQGTMTLSASGMKYVGEFENGLPNGQGTGTYPDGTIYTGEWKNGKQP